MVIQTVPGIGSGTGGVLGAGDVDRVLVGVGVTPETDVDVGCGGWVGMRVGVGRGVHAPSDSMISKHVVNSADLYPHRAGPGALRTVNDPDPEPNLTQAPAASAERRDADWHTDSSTGTTCLRARSLD